MIWLNNSQPDSKDIAALKDLIRKGQFEMWLCPVCITNVYKTSGVIPSQLMGSTKMGTQDFDSYPGTGNNDKRCDSCRCQNLLPGMVTSRI